MSDSLQPHGLAAQAPPSIGSSRQEYWRGLPFSYPGDLPNLGIEPTSPASPAFPGRFFTTEPPGKPRKQDHLVSSCEISVVEVLPV